MNIKVCRINTKEYERMLKNVMTKECMDRPLSYPALYGSILLNILYINSFQWIDVGGACRQHAAEACTSHEAINRAKEL